MEKYKTWKKITLIGNKIRTIWSTNSKRYKIPITIQGIPALSNFSFCDKANNSLFRSYLINSLLNKNILSSNIFYTSISHTNNIIKRYSEAIDEGFSNLKESIDNESIFKLKKKLKTSITFRK